MIEESECGKSKLDGGMEKSGKTDNGDIGEVGHIIDYNTLTLAWGGG